MFVSLIHYHYDAKHTIIHPTQIEKMLRVFVYLYINNCMYVL